MNKNIFIICIIGLFLLTGCANTANEVQPQNDMPVVENQQAIEEKIDVAEILAIRQNYLIELNEWKTANCFTDSYTNDLKLDLKITNNNEDRKLDYLTIKVNQYDAAGELLGFGRTSVKVSVLEPQTTDYALPCIRGALPETANVKIEIEENPPEEAFRFFNELQ